MFCYTILVLCHLFHFIVMTNRIFVSNNTISYVVYNIFISLHIEMLFDITNIRVVRW